MVLFQRSVANLKRSDLTQSYLIAPNVSQSRLTRRVSGKDQTGASKEINVVEERPLTIFLNSQDT